MADAKAESRKTTKVFGEVGGDEWTGSFDGYVTRTIYTAIGRYMGAHCCTKAQALEKLRAASRTTRRDYGMKMARQGAGLQIIGGMAR